MYRLENCPEYNSRVVNCYHRASHFLLKDNMFSLHTVSHRASEWHSSGQWYKWSRIVNYDQIGRFLKVLGNKIYSKRSPKDWQLFGRFRKTSLLCKNCIGYFLGNFWKKLGYFLLQHLVTMIMTLELHWLEHCLLLDSRVVINKLGFVAFVVKHE